MRVRRIDAVTVLRPARLDRLEVTGDGYQLYDALFARTGLQEYSDGRGGTIVEYRPFSEVDASLPSYELRPLTDLHPASNVNADTARVLARGAMSGAHWHEASPADLEVAHVAGRLAVWDGALQKKFDAATASGKPMQLSMGYTLDLDETPGVTPFGKRYDAVQRSMRINHGAAVPLGRAGSAQVVLDGVGWSFDLAKRLDDFTAHVAKPILVDMGRWASLDASEIRTQTDASKGVTPEALGKKKKDNTMKLTTNIDGKPVEFTIADTAKPQEVADAAAKLHADHLVRATADHKTELVKARDAIPPEFLAKQKKKKGEEEEKAKKDAADSDRRTDAIGSAKAIIGMDYSASGKATQDIQLDVVESASGKDRRAEVEAMDAELRPGATALAYSRACKSHAARPTHADALLERIQTKLGKRTDAQASADQEWQEKRDQAAERAENPQMKAG